MFGILAVILLIIIITALILFVSLIIQSKNKRSYQIDNLPEFDNMDILFDEDLGVD